MFRLKALIVPLLSFLIVVSAHAAKAEKRQSAEPAKKEEITPAAESAPKEREAKGTSQPTETTARLNFGELLLGPARIDGEGEFIVSARIGRVITENSLGRYSLGLYTGWINDEFVYSNIRANLNIWLFLAEGMLRDIKGSGFYVGPKAGMASIFFEITATNPNLRSSSNATTFVYGGGAGYTLRFDDRSAIVFDVTRLQSEETTITILTTPVSLGKLNGWTYQVGYNFTF